MAKGLAVDELDNLLGIDPTHEQDALAAELVRADFAWVQQLVTLRKELGLNQADVAAAMGRTQSAVSDIETMSSDPRLSTLRRYALAIGVAVRHRAFRHAAPHPLLAAQHGGHVAAHSASAGSGQPVRASGLFVSSSSRVRVGT